MKAPRLARWLASRLIEPRRPADFVIGDPDRPYLLRWWLLPRNPIFNVYLHHFLRSDDDRALHDHPWPSLSIALRGQMVEHTFAWSLTDRRVQRHLDEMLHTTDASPLIRASAIEAGDIRYRGARFAHRVELPAGEDCWTLVITGPTVRAWGFWCEGVRWVHWERFTQTTEGGSVTGRGCG